MFRDRIDAGRRLARALIEHLGVAAAQDRPVILGLPRGGVPVAAQVAEAFGAPLDIIAVRKLGVPFQPELAMGAIGEGGVRVLNPDVLRAAGVSARDLAAVETEERLRLERRAARFRSGRARTPVAGRVVVIVDDGLATGSTARAACAVARAHGARRVILAVPVAPPDWEFRLEDAADDYVAVATPEPFYAVGQFYDDFRQTGDEEVIRALRDAPSATDHDCGEAAGRDEEVRLHVAHRGATIELAGHLDVPTRAVGTVVFAHGSGSSRHSPRNRYVAGLLNDAGLATLLFDLLTPDEELVRKHVFDIELLADRLAGATHWLRQQDGLRDVPMGYFGASTGAAAALVASTRPDARIAAIVSRGGRPDLAGPALDAVTAPTLLIVGGDDDVVLALNRRARAQLCAPSALVVVPGATHLFEEPGTLQAAADAARDWFLEHFTDDDDDING